MISSISSAAELTVTNTVHLEQGATVDPKAMALTRDNGFIVAGSLGSEAQRKSAWAVKTDSKGNVMWRYVTSRKDNPVYGQPSFIQSPVFNALAVMPDDSVFLCGFMPGIEHSFGLLTHLDKNGKVLNEQLLRHEAVIRGNISSCASGSGGLVTIGKVATFQHTEATKTEPGSVLQNNFYWILSFDTSGKTKWEKLLPISKQLGTVDRISPIQMAADGSFVFVAQRIDDSEIVSVKPDGDIAARHFLNGLFTILLPTQEQAPTDIQLLSIFTGKLTRITFSHDLQETGRATEEHEDGVVHLAYRMPDQSLMLFGSKPNSRGGENYAWVMHIDPAHHEGTLTLAPDAESLWIDAGVVTNKSGEFASARRVFKPFKPGQETFDLRLSAALDFISIK